MTLSHLIGWLGMGILVCWLVVALLTQGPWDHDG